MERYNELFLQALRASLKNEKLLWGSEISEENWNALFKQAEIHHVLPMIYDVVYNCPASKLAPEGLLLFLKRKTIQQVMLQTMKTEAFLQIVQYLNQESIDMLVVKGIICRNIYPNPDYRISGDEDVLVPSKQFVQANEKLATYGMKNLKPEEDVATAHEISYGMDGSPVYIELHQTLFAQEAEAYGEWNRYFEHAFEHAVTEKVQGICVKTLGYTDHLFYLICHAFKHFLHSGFGLRQVCDIIMFANRYGKEIDWQRIVKQCREIKAEYFTVALFRIGEKYLIFSPEKACYPKEWQKIKVDETALLEDLLSSGVYGQSNMSRKHSSNITLNAVAAEKKGKKASGNVLGIVFPSAKKLEGRYTYLKKYPFLLPVAWTNRLITYQKETKNTKENDAAESMRIGNQRIELMKQYHIID